MPSKPHSPYAASFTTAVKNGTPCSTVVFNISKRTNKPASTVWNSLFKAGLCCRTKFNGTWVYWPNFPVKKNSTASNATQTNMWQSFVDWCMTSGCCTPWQLKNRSTSQKNFMTYCRTFFNKQFTWTTKSTGKTTTRRRPRTASRTTTPSWKTWSKPNTTWTTKHTRKTRKGSTRRATPAWTTTYKFPTFKNRTTTRRYARAA